MNGTNASIGDAALGLYMLMGLSPEAARWQKNRYHASQDKTFLFHPLGLELRGGYIRFVGGASTDASVMNLLGFIRDEIGYARGRTVERLQVISAQSRDHGPGKHYVFFEIHVTGNAYLSGETTDFSGGGDSSRLELESVFAALAATHGIEIGRVTLREPLDIRELYRRIR